MESQLLRNPRNQKILLIFEQTPNLNATLSKPYCKIIRIMASPRIL